MNSRYIYEPNKIHLAEYIASQMYQPSYISLEYVLKKYNLLAKNSPPSFITSITSKSTHAFKNFAGNYRYSNIKPSLFTCFEKHSFHGHIYHIATKGKALFDYLYLDSNLARRNDKHLRHQLFEESGIQWNHFYEEDFKEFDNYVWKINSAKMEKIWHTINEHFEKKKFNAWAKELLN